VQHVAGLAVAAAHVERPAGDRGQALERAVQAHPVAAADVERAAADMARTAALLERFAGHDAVVAHSMRSLVC
jgi:hypothetical protein